MREKLTVLIPCKNESCNIGSCIESVRGLADEILVADSGSTDDTLDIVRTSGGCRIIEREWNGYAGFKNWAIPSASHPWVLIVDADERVTPELAAEIRQVLADPREDVDAYRIRHRTFFLGHEIVYCGRNTNSACRLIRRDVCRYREVRVHEEIVVAPRRVKRLKNRFVHYEYRDYDHYFAKRIRYTRLGAEDYWEEGKRANVTGLLLRPFLRFFQLYFLRLGVLDGLPGIQYCILTAFCNTFVKQARLWEMQHTIPQETAERAVESLTSHPTDSDFPQPGPPEAVSAPAESSQFPRNRWPLSRAG